MPHESETIEEPVTRRLFTPTRVAQVALLMSLPACAKSCSERNPSVMEFTADVYETLKPEGIADMDFVCKKVASSKAGTDRYMAVIGRKSADGASALVRSRYELWAPFRIEGTIGIFNSRSDELVRKASGGIDVGLRQAAPATSFGVRFRRTETGVEASALDNSGATLGTLQFPGDTRIDAAIEYDGSKIRFFARGRNLSPASAAFAEIASASLVQSVPMNPGCFVGGLDPGVEMGFDNFDIVVAGFPPIPWDEARLATQDLHDAIDAIGDAVRVIDGLFPGDPATAIAYMHTATIEISAVRGYVESLPGKKPSTPKIRALAALTKAEKAIAKAKATLTKKGAAGIASALKQLIDKAPPQLFAAGVAVAPAKR